MRGSYLRGLFGVLLVGGAWSAVGAQLDSTNDEAEILSDKIPLWTESLLWTKDIVLRAGLGYKDNVLLSPTHPQGSAFVASGLDLTLFRLPLDGWEFTLSMTGDDTRFFRNPGGVKGEDLFLGSAQLQRYFAGVWRAGLEVRYSYVDQVLQDLSLTGHPQVFLARGNLFGFRPFVRRDLGTNWWLQLEAPLASEWWRSPLDQQWKPGGQAIVGRSYGYNSKVTLAYGGYDIAHSDWLAQDALGNEIPGRKLEIWRQAAELKWDHHWDAAQHWSTATKLGFNYEADNGGGYVNYYRYLAGEELRFHTRDWDFKAGATVNYYDFPVQTVDGPGSPKLRLTTLDLSARVERRVFGSFRVFALFEHDQTISNEAMSQYRANIVTGGVSYEF